MTLNNYIPIDFTQVQINDMFWTPRIEKVRSVAMPHTYMQLQKTGRLDAFKLQWKPGMPNPPHIFWDSDVAKWVESAAILLQSKPDLELQQKLEDTVNLIVNAQQPDGYLNTHFTVVNPGKRWTHLKDHHELYCAGHLMEAAVEHYKLTKDPKFLNAMSKYTDHIISVFGREPGKKRGYCGHPEIELALMKMYQLTKDSKYLTLSKYFVDERGAEPDYYLEEAIARGEKIKGFMEDYNPNDTLLGRPHDTGMYYLNHLPIREMDEITGHAVRAFYLFTGAADVAIETEDKELLDALILLWKDTITRKMYITGGIGSARQNEGFEKAYILPNAEAYCETCAAISLVFFAHRMLQLECNGEFADIIERALYNGILSSYSLEGNAFLYENPLAVLPTRRGFKRDEWFGCSCCPNNFTRLMGSLGQYVYSIGNNQIVIHQYLQSAMTVNMNGIELKLSQTTKYPWNGEIEVKIESSDPKLSQNEIGIRLRIPKWCRSHEIQVIPQNASQGMKIEKNLDKGYQIITRKWNNGDIIKIHLEMPVERIYSNPKVSANIGRVALQRGPIVYCIEEKDNGQDIDTIFLLRGNPIQQVESSEFLPGSILLKMKGERPAAEGNTDELYFAKTQSTPVNEIEITAIPYCFWNNRGSGEMEVWIREK